MNATAWLVIISYITGLGWGVLLTLTWQRRAKAEPLSTLDRLRRLPK